MILYSIKLYNTIYDRLMYGDVCMSMVQVNLDNSIVTAPGEMGESASTSTISVCSSVISSIIVMDTFVVGHV